MTRYNNINPPRDRPFETIQNFHFQKCPLVLYTHGDTIWTVLVASCTTIQIHSNGFRGFIDSPLRSIQTRFCISCTTIWKDPNMVFVLADLPFKTIWGINTVHSYFTIQNHNSEWIQMVHQLVWKIQISSKILEVCNQLILYLWKLILILFVVGLICQRWMRYTCCMGRSLTRSRSATRDWTSVLAGSGSSDEESISGNRLLKMEDGQVFLGRVEQTKFLLSKTVSRFEECQK